jgi:hypothetical protein
MDVYDLIPIWRKRVTFPELKKQVMESIKLVKENQSKIIHKLSGIHDTFVTTRCGIRIKYKGVNRAVQYKGKEECVTCVYCK